MKKKIERKHRKPHSVTENIERRLKKHDPFCKIHNYSDENRHCSCGRDEAIKELKLLNPNCELEQ
jgi:hypothetical protein